MGIIGHMLGFKTSGLGLQVVQNCGRILLSSISGQHCLSVAWWGYRHNVGVILGGYIRVILG